MINFIRRTTKESVLGYLRLLRPYLNIKTITKQAKGLRVVEWENLIMIRVCLEKDGGSHAL